MLARRFQEAGLDLEVRQAGAGTLHATSAGVRITFLEYRYPLLHGLESLPADGCSLASLDDLACMKLAAAAQRGARKDFIDIYALALHHCALAEMLALYRQKYGVADTVHVLRGLTYFDEADTEPAPRVLWRMNWRTVKAAIRTWVREVAATG